MIRVDRHGSQVIVLRILTLQLLTSSGYEIKKGVHTQSHTMKTNSFAKRAEIETSRKKVDAGQLCRQLRRFEK